MHVSVVGNPDGSVVVTVRGNLDIDSATVLSTALEQVLHAGEPRIVVDLSGVEFCDSTGVNVLLAAHQRLADQGGSLALAAPTSTVRRILQVTGLDTVFTVLDAVPAFDTR